jgi:hypothetical protein
MHNFATRTVAFSMFVFAVAGSAMSQILVSGSTVGRFNSNSFTVLPNDTQSFLGITFRGSTFSDTTSQNFVAFGSPPTVPNFNNYGSFTLDTTPNSYFGNTFSLRLVFITPGAVSGDFFVANVLGAVSGTGGGGVTFDFDGAQTFNYSGGTFTVKVDNTNVNPGFSVPITGWVTTQPVPEPTTMAALGIGAVGILRVRRRKVSK